jgi:DNA polymerase elongation subunit (family B)
MSAYDSASYSVVNDKTKVVLYRDYEVEEITNPDPLPYCFIPSSYNFSVNGKRESTTLYTIDSNELVDKYSFALPKSVSYFRERVERTGLKAYEADKPYVTRYMIDNKIRCTDYKNSAAIDFEMDDSKGQPNPQKGNVPIISWAITFSDGETISRDSIDNEKQLLLDFVDIVKSHKITLLKGWNSKYFDTPFFINRMFVNGLLDREIFDQHAIRWLDLGLMYQFAEKQYKSRWGLDSVAKRILGMSKPFINRRISSLTTQERIDRVAWDSKAVYEIDKRNNYSGLAIEMARLSYSFPDKMLNANPSKHDQITATEMLDNLFFEYARKHGYVLPCKSPRKTTFPGAFVYIKQSGLFNNVAQFDFTSLYPNVALCYHYAPYGKVEFFENIIKTILYNKTNASTKTERWAWKISANAIYGIMASKYYRFDAFDVARNIASKAKEIITAVKSYLEQTGYTVIYCDTDSVFVIINSQDQITSLQTLINDFVKQYTGSDNIQMRFETLWKHIAFPRSAGGTNVRKKYYGVVLNNGKEKMEWTGMEILRGDWSELSKQIQLYVLEHSFPTLQKEEILKYVDSVIRDMYDGKLNDKLVLERRIREHTDSYKVKQPHVKAFESAKESGWVPNEMYQTGVVQFYMTKGNKPVISALLKEGEIDYDWYLTHQIAPILYRLNVIDDPKIFIKAKQNMVNNQTTLFGF